MIFSMRMRLDGHLARQPLSYQAMRTHGGSKSAALLLVACGVAVSGYLLHRHFVLTNASAAGKDFCSAVFGASCDETLRSEWAVQLGLPLAGWGLVYYGTLGALLLIEWSVGEESEATLGALVLGLVAAVLSVALLVVMLAGLTPFCPLCAVAHVVNLALVYPLKRLTGRSAAQLVKAVAAGVHYCLGGKAANPGLARWRLVGFFSAALVAVVLYQWVYVEYALRAFSAEAAFDPEETLELFERIRPVDIFYDSDDAQLGDAQGAIRLVVFSDFECPACTEFARTLRGLRERFGDRLHVVFKHFPLSSTCNPLVRTDLHGNACEAAWAAEAARRQNRFWVFHDTLFEARLSTSDIALETLARQAGLDLARFRADRRLQSVRDKVQSNTDQGIRLGVDGTPGVYLNGRRVYDLRPQAVEFLISHELDDHGN